MPRDSLISPNRPKAKVAHSTARSKYRNTLRRDYKTKAPRPGRHERVQIFHTFPCITTNLTPLVPFPSRSSFTTLELSPGTRFVVEIKGLAGPGSSNTPRRESCDKGVKLVFLSLSRFFLSRVLLTEEAMPPTSLSQSLSSPLSFFSGCCPSRLSTAVPSSELHPPPLPRL